MGQISVAAGANQTGACASFFVGTPDNEPQLRLAHQWAANIVDAVADGARAQLGLLVSMSALLNQLRTMQDVMAANAAISPNPALGNLNQSTIVLLTRALADKPGAPQGVLLYGSEEGAGSVLLIESQLDQMLLNDVTDPLPRKAVEPQPGAAADVIEAAVLLDFLRRSSYVALYLCTVGVGRGVDKLAQKLAPLIDMTVFFNVSPLVLVSKSGTLQAPQVSDASGAVVNGTEYQGTQSVSLAASDNKSFLPGAEQRQ